MTFLNDGGFFRRGLQACVLSSLAYIPLTFFPSSSYAQEISPLLPVSPDVLSWQYKPDASSSEQRVALLGYGIMGVKSVGDAVDVVRRDDVPAMILVGDFSQSQISNLGSAMQRLCALNSRLVSSLEPVVVKLSPGNVSGALSNERSCSLENLGVLVKKYGGGKEYGDVASNDSYTKKVESAKGKNVQIPSSDEEYAVLLKKSIALQKSRADGFDVILHGVQDSMEERIVIHELGHLIFREDGSGYDTLMLLRDKGSNIARSVEHWSEYVAQREEEVDAWMIEKIESLDAVIRVLEPLSVSERSKMVESRIDSEKDVYRRVSGALSSMGSERLMDEYKNLLNVASLYWRLAESVAEDVVDISMNDEHFDFCHDWTTTGRQSMIEILPEEKRNIQGLFDQEKFDQSMVSGDDDLDGAYIELVKSMDEMAELFRHDEYTIVHDFL